MRPDDTPDSVEGGSLQKRARTVNEEGFDLTFDNLQPLRILVDVIQNILQRVEVKVVKNDTFEGIHIECIDSKHVCLIVARLSANVSYCSDDTTFCVDTTTFNTCLKAVQPHFSLTMKNNQNSADIQMCAYESISNNYFTTFNVPTLVHDSDSVKLTDLDYEYTIEMDLNTLRNIVKNTLALKGNKINLTIEVPKETMSYNYTVFTITTDGAATQKHQFHSVTENRQGSTCVIRTEEGGVDIPEVEKFEKKYDGDFSASYLSSFLKSMERQVISMRLSEGKPLILNYPLGTEASYICFVLASKANDD
tara:strand:+ start:258 stop:1178 length:921 start_codon:yes stop_codon:yes gene_type:complete